MTTPKDQQKLIRLGRIAEIKKRLGDLETRIIALSASIATALYTTGEVDQVDTRTAKQYFADLEAAKDEWDRLGRELDGLEDE
jgi:hypothetical protein